MHKKERKKGRGSKNENKHKERILTREIEQRKKEIEGLKQKKGDRERMRNKER